MNMNIFFSNKAEQIDFITKRLNIDAMRGNLKKLENPAPGLASLRLKSSHKGIPGFWVNLTLQNSSTGKQLKNDIYHFIEEDQLEEIVFFPKEPLKVRELEEGWLKKYRLLDEPYQEEAWSIFYKEVRVHMGAKRYDTAYYGLLVMLKYNPFFLKKYRRFYQFEELAYYYEETGNIGKAIKCLKVHLMLQPDSVEPYLNMSSFFIMNEMEEEAISVCKEALKKNPNNKYLISNLVLALSNLGNYEYAVEYMRKIMRKQPDSPYYWKLLGDLLYEIERNEEAVDCYKRSLRLLKNQDWEFMADLYNGIAAASYELEHYEESVSYYKKVLEHVPNDSYVLLSLSQIYFYKLENVNEALQYGKLLLEGAPENGYGHYQIGLIYMKLENFEKAKWHLYRAKKIMPYYEPVLEAIHYLKQVNKIIKIHDVFKEKKR
ncbi:tetratricopeptide repeat protein [Alkaliphilus crotonatoxidans]